MAYESSHSVVYYDPRKTYDGYTYFDPMGGTEAYLIDMRGWIVHQWQFTKPPALHSMFLPNGNVLRPQQTEIKDELLKVTGLALGGRGGEVVEVDWDGNLVWRYEDGYMNHTVTRWSNGNTMVLRWYLVPDDMLFRIPGGYPGTELTAQGQKIMWADGLQEVTSDGKIVWEWVPFGHMKPEEWPICPLCPRSEWTHANSVIEMPDGNVMMCCRHISRIFIIDKMTGNILWRWGEGELSHPHDPTIVDNGNVLLFDNGDAHRFDGSPIDWSRVVEINIKTGQIDWEYRSNPPMEFYSALCAGCQRLPNGNTLICETEHGRIFEITREGEIVWEFINPFYTDWTKPQGLGRGNPVFRAYRFSPEYPGLKGRALDRKKYQKLNQIYGPDAQKLISG